MADFRAFLRFFEDDKNTIRLPRQYLKRTRKALKTLDFLSVDTLNLHHFYTKTTTICV